MNGIQIPFPRLSKEAPGMLQIIPWVLLKVINSKVRRDGTNGIRHRNITICSVNFLDPHARSRPIVKENQFRTPGIFDLRYIIRVKSKASSPVRPTGFDSKEVVIGIACSCGSFPIHKQLAHLHQITGISGDRGAHQSVSIQLPIIYCPSAAQYGRFTRIGPECDLNFPLRPFCGA